MKSNLLKLRMMATTTDMALDDIKKADEIISMALLGPNTSVTSNRNGPLGTAGPPSSIGTFGTKGPLDHQGNEVPKKGKFWSTLSLNQRSKKKPQRQFSNAFPCPIIRSETLDSPEGSVSSLGLVHSTPFASLAMTSIHAKRARNAYHANRTISDQTAQNEVRQIKAPSMS